jgi:signal transduction histidine kinase
MMGERLSTELDARDSQPRPGDLIGRWIAAQEAERTRIARDLHDDVCQDVAAISVDLSYLRQHGRDMTNQELETALLSIECRTVAVAETLRRLSHGLHPAVLQHVGLVAALQSHCAEIERQHHLDVHLFAEGRVEPLEPQIALSLFRIAQEALRNVARHAHARRVTVSIVRRRQTLTVRIADDGHGFDLAAARKLGGLGLVSIEERVRLAKGHVEIRSSRDNGTTIEICVPMDAEDAPDRPDEE